jgi:Mg/Co/Ni transporter MgtE
MECLGLHNKPTAEVHPGHMLTSSKEEEEEEEDALYLFVVGNCSHLQGVISCLTPQTSLIR